MSDELIPIGETDEGLPMSLDPTKAAAQDGHWSSIPEETDEGKCLVYNAMSAGCLSGRDFIGKPIPVKHLLIHVVSIADPDTGEVSDAPRTILLSHDGVAVSFCAAGIVQSLKRAIKMWGSPPWDPPLVFTPIEQKTRRGWRTTILTCNGRMVPKEGGNATS